MLDTTPLLGENRVFVARPVIFQVLLHLRLFDVWNSDQKELFKVGT